MRHFAQSLLLAMCASTASGFQMAVPSAVTSKMSTSLNAVPRSGEEPENDAPTSELLERRQALAMFGTSLALMAVTAPAAQALDMDAFMNSQLESDTKNCDPKRDPKCIPKLSADEALCKYGQSGNARGEACKRVKQAGGTLPSAQPQGKSLGGAYAM